MKSLTVLLAIIFGLSVLIIFPYIFFQLNSYFSLPIFSYFPLKVLGMILILIGGSLYLYCFSLFHFLGKGTPVPIEPPKKLVIKGVYKYTRNPMYISLLIILLGYFLYFGHLSLFFYFLFIMIFFHLFVVFYEEPALKKKFRNSYIEYCKKTRRWL